MGKVTVICGPPGSGKTTLVRRIASPGDLVIDVDAIYQALSGLAVYHKPEPSRVLAARDGALNHLEAAADVAAWIITTGARVAERNALQQRFDARVVVLAVPIDECLRRIAQDATRSGSLSDWKPLVAKWWSEYEPDDSDLVLN